MRKAIVGLALVSAFLLSGCSASSLTVNGSISVPWGGLAGAHDPMPCMTNPSGGYKDVAEGTQVLVSDNSGNMLAKGTLGAGKTSPADGSLCEFPFTVDGVEGGKPLYSVEVGHRGALTYSEAELAEDLKFSLGN